MERSAEEVHAEQVAVCAEAVAAAVATTAAQQEQAGGFIGRPGEGLVIIPGPADAA